MSILLDASTRLLVQGMTGSQGSFHTHLMRESGTNVVAGVTPVSYTHLSLPTNREV